jgi:hypothetical protein
MLHLLQTILEMMQEINTIAETKPFRSLTIPAMGHTNLSF